MWPFKKREPAIPFMEYVKTLEPAPCGNQYEHYYWKLTQNFPCPACAAEKVRKSEQESEDRMAEKIAAAVVRRLSVGVVKGVES